MVVVILSTIILRIVASHSRLTHHQVSRIPAQYAAKAGVIYALDKLRRNDDATCWPSTGTYTNCIRSSGSSCVVVPGGCLVTELNLPVSVTEVDITVYDLAAAWPNQSLNSCRKVSAKATYTYTP
ncbi:MAG: hypothetical protein Q8N80_01970 [Candidatus Omnitrophota bacterium]|nr:hypothetical protein [Candidatus Omnitrophota bacterium]